MSRSSASPASADRPRKSPLRLAAGGEASFPPRQSGRLSPGQLRAMMISEFEQWLRSRTNQEKRPFQEETVVAYAKAARALDAWMTEKKIDGDFTACDTALLNGFFRYYDAAHTRGGTKTKQRNLRHLFTWLEAEYDHPHPYTDDLSRYAPARSGPSVHPVGRLHQGPPRGHRRRPRQGLRGRPGPRAHPSAHSHTSALQPSR